MQKFLCVLFLIIGLKACAQFDTTYISKVFEYISSSKFNQEYNDSLDAQYTRSMGSRKWKKKDLRRFKRYKTAEGIRMDNKCFVLYGPYFIPDSSADTLNNTLQLQYDSLYHRVYKKGSEISSKAHTPSADTCTKTLIFSCYFLRPDVIELRHFYGTRPFGEEWQFRFRINGDTSVTFIRRGATIYN